MTTGVSLMSRVMENTVDFELINLTIHGDGFHIGQKQSRPMLSLSCRLVNPSLILSKFTSTFHEAQGVTLT